MDLDWKPEDLAFREEVRAFFADHLTPDIKRAGALMTSLYADHATQVRWQKILYRKGWVAPGWPVEYGGCGWSVTKRYIFAQERVAAGAPPLSPMSLDQVPYVIMRFGTAGQKQRFLPPTLAGDLSWCQGYSEPESGSDLASLQMKAVQDGDDLVCNGSKIWVTHAHEADWMFCLVRTSHGARPQQGISFLLIDMKTPGIEVRPIVMMSGEYIQNQIFFRDVRVPKANVLGEIGSGWSVAKYLLEHERGVLSSAAELQVRLSQLRQHAAAQPGNDGRRLLDDPAFVRKIVESEIRINVLEMLEFRLLSDVAEGESAGVQSSMMKILGTELSQSLTELALETAGPMGIRYQPQAAAPGGSILGRPLPEGAVAGEAWQSIAPLRYLNERAGSIYAGSNEIQRNILAKAILAG